MTIVGHATAARPEVEEALKGLTLGSDAWDTPVDEVECPVLRDVVARSAFEAEAQRHLGALFGFALKLARSRDDAEDLVSDTYLRAIERWEQFRPGTNMRAWLFTILYHLFISRKRRIDAREVVSTDDPDTPVAFEAVGESDPEGAFYDSFIDEEIVGAIEALPEEYRSAVLMSDVHGMRYSEIATALGVPEGTVKSRLFRGRRTLQRRLRGYAVDMGYLRAGPARLPESR